MDSINYFFQVLSSVLWGYTSQDTMRILEEFFPEGAVDK